MEFSDTSKSSKLLNFVYGVCDTNNRSASWSKFCVNRIKQFVGCQKILTICLFDLAKPPSERNEFQTVSSD